MSTPSNTVDLTGRVVAVTGGAGRLGRILVRHLAEAGAAVAALDLRPHDVGDLPLHADLTDPDSTEAAFGAVVDRLGAVHAVVHTVGTWAGSPLAETPLEEWRRVIDVNLTSAFVVFREAARRMLAAGTEGQLIGIASGQGADKGVARQAAYSASKAGVVRLVESVAAEYRDAGITAVAVAPSMILFGDEGPETRGVEADEVARLCVTLCGPAGAVHNGSVMRAYGSMR